MKVTIPLTDRTYKAFMEDSLDEMKRLEQESQCIKEVAKKRKRITTLYRRKCKAENREFVAV